MAGHRVLYLNHNVDAKKQDLAALLKADFETVPASLTRHALGYMRVVRPDVVISNYQLPDGDASQLLQSMASSAEFSGIPVAVVLDETESSHEAMMRQLGAAAIIFRSNDSAQLIRTANDLAKLHGDSREEEAMGITGQLARLGIMELITEMAEEHGSGVISIDGSIAMEIYLQDGEIIHSRHGITVGIKALYRCLRIAEAAYHFSNQSPKVERTIEGELQTLIEQAKESNQRLMANSHRLPQPNHRIRIKYSDELKNTNLKHEARAALEVAKRYPRVKDYVDHFNIIDTHCYEYLFTFIERDFIEITDQQRPVAILVDSSCDMHQLVKDEGVQPIALKMIMDDRKVIADHPDLVANTLKYKIKQLEKAIIATSSEDAYLERCLTQLETHDCLSIFPAPELVPIQTPAMRNLVKLRQVGHQGQPLLANELMQVETKSFSLGLGLMAYQAALMAKDHQPIEVIHDFLVELAPRIHVLVAVQAGKSPLAPKGGGPLISIWDKDHFKALDELARGQSVHDALAAFVLKRIDVKSPIRLAIGHIQAQDVAKKLHEALVDKLHLGLKHDPFPLGPITSSILGEGAVAVAFHQL